jgi:exosortase J
MTVNMEVVAPGSEMVPGAKSRLTGANAPLLWCAMALLTAAGCLGIRLEIAELWTSWMTDPLRSFGILIPPASIVLTLRVWHRYGWEKRGTWWGLPVIGLAFLLNVLREKMLLYWFVGSAAISLQPLSLPVYVYGSGVVLLFAGTRVWRKAWFPLGLLLLSQPVPILTSQIVDIPLQNLSARVAREFATLIGFAPTTPQLRLMFSPDFGMFIAPGCDGIRGAVAMGYVALVLGYLKRVSAPLWAAYVGGAVLLGYLFNFIRLCVLVLYYRIALGHPALEGVAKQADYAIGSCLFLTAALLFMWLARRKGKDEPPVGPAQLEDLRKPWNGWMKCASFAVLLVAALSVFASPLRVSPPTTMTQASLAARMPQHVGEYTLTRTWYEQQSGMIVMEAGAYDAPGSDEIILGVSVAQNFDLHMANGCWLARGLSPDLLESREYRTGNGESVPLDTGFYNDGITDSVVVNAFCGPLSCSQFRRTKSSGRVGFLALPPQMYELAGSRTHVVSIMVRIDKLHSMTQKEANYDLLSAEAQKYIAGLNLLSVSRDFQ